MKLTPEIPTSEQMTRLLYKRYSPSKVIYEALKGLPGIEVYEIKPSYDDHNPITEDIVVHDELIQGKIINHLKKTI